MPENFSINPNPFNPVTKIQFDIPPDYDRSGNSIASIIIYDALGSEVHQLVNEYLSAGSYETEFDGSNFASGIYYYTLTYGKKKTDSKNDSAEMVIVFLQ